MGGPSTGGPTTPGGGGPRTNGGGGPTTGGWPDFIPGQDGSLYWNTSVSEQGRPALVYLYNGHNISDDDCKRSRLIEKNCFPDKSVIAEARGFVCEKICFGCSEFNRRPHHREAIRDYLERVARTGTFESKVVLLDGSGQILVEFNDQAPTPKKLAAALKKSRVEKKLASAQG